MKNFFKIYEKALKNTNLRRVRLKVDPLKSNLENYVGVESFTGYILSEDALEMKFMIFGGPNGGSGEVVSIPQDSVTSLQDDPVAPLEVVKDDSGLERFKSRVIEFLASRNDITSNVQMYDNIKTCKCFEDIEAIINSVTNDTNIILKLYRLSLEN